MKKNSVSSIMRSVGIAMAIGGATALVGSAVTAPKNASVKRMLSDALKSMEKML